MRLAVQRAHDAARYLVCRTSHLLNLAGGLLGRVIALAFGDDPLIDPYALSASFLESCLFENGQSPPKIPYC